MIYYVLPNVCSGKSDLRGGDGDMPIFTFISNQNPCKIIIIQSCGFH